MCRRAQLFFSGGQAMGGDSRSGVADDASNQATQNLLSALNHKLVADSTPSTTQPQQSSETVAQAQPGQDAPVQTTAPYGGVAPGAANPGQASPGTDRYYTPQPGHQTRAGYGISVGSGYFGGAGVAPNKPGGEAVPNFIQAHKDAQRDPNTPYEANPVGAQAAAQINNPNGRVQAPGVAPDTSNEDRIRAAISSRGQYASPYTIGFGLAGALTAPFTAKGLNLAADAAVEHTKEGGWVSNAGKYWQNNYDAAKVGKRDFIKIDPKHAAADDAYSDLVSTAKQAKTTAAASGDADALALAERRLDLLPNTPTREVLANIQSANRQALKDGGQALFENGEVSTVEGKISASLARAAQDAANSKYLAGEGGIKGLWRPFSAGLAGIGMDLAAVNVDRSLGKLIGGSASINKSYNTEQILAPLAIAMGETWQTKLGYLGLSIAASRLIDGGTQAVGLGAPSWLNAPTGVMNGWDGFGVATGIAIAASTSNPYAKALAVGVGYGIPKLIHFGEDQAVGNLQARFNDLNDDIQADHKKRSYSSLEDTKDAAISLNEKKQDWLQGKVDQNRTFVQTNWTQMQPDQKLLSFRDDADMAAALGEDLLKNGSRIMKQGQREYTLGGYQMDLGGQAMFFLLTAKDSAQRAENMTNGIIQNNNDSSKTPILVNGKAPTQSEVDGLDKFKGNITKDLSKILDQEHDCNGVLNQVVKDLPGNTDLWRNTYILPTDKMIEMFYPRLTSNQTTPEDKAETSKVLGKLYRDQAIAYMALAKSNLDNGKDGLDTLNLLQDRPDNHNDIFPDGKQKSYNGAQGVLRMAQLFDPNNPDLKQLQPMLQSLLQRAQQAAGAQMNDPHQNILQVHPQ